MRAKTNARVAQGNKVHLICRFHCTLGTSGVEPEHFDYQHESHLDRQEDVEVLEVFVCCINQSN